MDALLVFCEGNHDIVFAQRSYSAITGLLPFDKTIAELPSPFGEVRYPKQPKQAPRGPSFIASRYSKRSLGDEKLSQAAHAPSPVLVRALLDKQRDLLVLLLRCGTYSAQSKVEEFLKELTATIANGQGRLEVRRFATAFVFDADTSVADREKRFRADYANIFTNLNLLSHGGWTLHGDVPVGLFIFSNAHGAGTLEDVLAPEVAKGWPNAWQAADEFLTHHSPKDATVHDTTAERLKAQMTIVGQPYFPGDPLSVVIAWHKKHVVLTSDAFQGPTSKALVQFLQSAPFTP
jgi:hypothetical protein